MFNHFFFLITPFLAENILFLNDVCARKSTLRKSENLFFKRAICLAKYQSGVYVLRRVIVDISVCPTPGLYISP